jgi:hypothetical protein
MPWSQTTPMDQKTQFIADYLRQQLSMTELCELRAGPKKLDRVISDELLR